LVEGLKIPEDWTLLNKLSHNDIKPFIKECLEVKGGYKTFYLLIMFSSMVLLGALVTFISIRFWKTNEFSGLSQFLGAFLFSISILVVIHELIHALAYKLKGAHHIYFGGSLKKFIFYAASDGDILNGKDFRFVALAPFVIVSLVNQMLIVFMPDYTIFFITVIALHNLFCGGDFAMINFINQYPLSKVFTFDLRRTKESYFYLSQ
jgi:hypothetical protein